jgi:hypothetical protein
MNAIERRCNYFDVPRRSARDRNIEAYISYLEREHQRLGAGTIGFYYLRCLNAAYREFQALGSRADRYRTWEVIHSTCRYLAKLSANREE